MKRSIVLFVLLSAFVVGVCMVNAACGASLSAIKGVNQAFARFTPFFTPKNAIRTKLGSGNIPFIGYFVITTLIQTKYPQKISTNNYNKN